MKQVVTKHILTLTGLLMGCFHASAVLTPVNPIGGNGSELSLQQVLNNRGNTLVNIQSDADQLDDSQDSYWTSLGGSSASIVIEIAGYAGNNQFGIFNPANPSERQQIFAGAATGGAATSFTPLWDTFGFYLQNTVDGNFTWFSDSALNPGGQLDHMVAYGGKGQTLALGGSAGNQLWDANSYILAWEDLNLGDWDYQDMVVLVRNVSSVPDAGSTLALFGATIVAVGFFRRRQ